MELLLSCLNKDKRPNLDLISSLLINWKTTTKIVAKKILPTKNGSEEEN